MSVEVVKPTKVFISYAHESAELADAVLDLSDYLRSEGVDAEIDQYEDAPPEGWPKWMMRQVQQAEFVLMVCSRLYHERANDFSVGGGGLGVKWETSLILQQLYATSTANTKFIPIFFGEEAKRWIPLPLQPYTHYDVADRARKAALLSRLNKTYTSKRPVLGVRQEEAASVVAPLGLKERKTLFVTSIIDAELWDKAGWKAMAFASDPMLLQAPIIGFVFRDDEAGAEIFRRLFSRFGPADEAEEIRLSFITEISGARPQDYKVHLGTEWSSFADKVKSEGLNLDDAYVMTLSRIHEMNPPAGSASLATFRDAFEAAKHYGITNIRSSGGQLYPDVENLIVKRNVHFRKKSDIQPPSDPDTVALELGRPDRTEKKAEKIKRKGKRR